VDRLDDTHDQIHCGAFLLGMGSYMVSHFHHSSTQGARPSQQDGSSPFCGTSSFLASSLTFSFLHAAYPRIGIVRASKWAAYFFLWMDARHSSRHIYKWGHEWVGDPAFIHTYIPPPIHLGMAISASRHLDPAISLFRTTGLHIHSGMCPFTHSNMAILSKRQKTISATNKASD